MKAFQSEARKVILKDASARADLRKALETGLLKQDKADSSTTHIFEVRDAAGFVVAPMRTVPKPDATVTTSGGQQFSVTVISTK